MQLRDQYRWYAEHLDQLVEDGDKAVKIVGTTAEALGLQSSQMLQWSNLEAIAHYEAEKAEERLKKILIPQAKALLRTRLFKKEAKSPSEARLDSDVLNDPAVAEGSRQVIDLKFIEALFKNVRIALADKKDDLISINARDCVELKSYQR